MKKVTVTTETGPVTVQLGHVSPDATLTPELVRHAARIAFDGTASCTVTDGETTWRVTGYGTNVRKRRSTKDHGQNTANQGL